jgi:hypothetical protein
VARGLRRSLLVGFAGVTLGACAAQRAPDGSEAALSALPPGPGRAILERECLKCHELDALELFKGFYTRDQWSSLIVTMRGNGAQIEDGELDVLAAYLERYFGTGDD